MEYTKDAVFEIQYNSKLNTIEVGKKRKIGKWMDKLKSNKLITTIIALATIMGIADTILISSFITILNTL